jgi:hypothetical protein
VPGRVDDLCDVLLVGDVSRGGCDGGCGEGLGGVCDGCGSAEEVGSASSELLILCPYVSSLLACERCE